MPICGLPCYPNLRHVRITNEGLHWRQQPSIVPAVSSFHSLRHLTRLSLDLAGYEDARELMLLSTLPALRSFEAECMHFSDGTDETLSEWLAVSAGRQALSPSSCSTLSSPSTTHAVVAVGHKRKAEEDEDPARRLRCSPLLLFLRALAVKPSLVHLRLDSCGLTPFVLEHMSVWPHLRCLSLVNHLRCRSVAHNNELNAYAFARAAIHFPSLTSLSTSMCSDEAVANLVQLPRLEELRFPDYCENKLEESVHTTTEGFRALSQAASLRSLVYFPHEGVENRTPSL